MDPVGICNLALGWLGERAIASLDDEAAASGSREELCARLYPEALRSLLEAKAWTFAVERLELAPAQATGLAEFPSKYLLPATVVRVLSSDDGSGANDLEYRREGGYLFAATSPATLHVRAITLLEDASKYSPGFVRALAARLAADLALPLTESRPLAAAMEEKYERELREAGRLDGQQGTSERQRPSALAARRW
jgi:hypothetical protein